MTCGASLKFRECNRKYFTSTQVKSSAAMRYYYFQILELKIMVWLLHAQIRYLQAVLPEQNDIIPKMAVFWVVAPCSLVEVYQRFRVPCCLHNQGDE
jgi:hypothetical protein